MNLLEEAAKLVRSTSQNLMPEALLENGLNEALRRYCNSISNDKLLVDYTSIGVEKQYPSHFKLSLYRIAQELINNMVKHSKATTALVQLSAAQNLLTLTVEDNGKGFHEHSFTKGTGLKSIYKRVAAMNEKWN